jgi:hypothetical protein
MLELGVKSEVLTVLTVSLPKTHEPETNGERPISHVTVSPSGSVESFQSKVGVASVVVAALAGVASVGVLGARL